MRNSTVQLPWISMMDLLFGLFGGLIILTMIITLKLGKNAGIESRPYSLITVSVSPVSQTDELVAEVLERMHVAFDITSLGGAPADKCLFSAASDSLDCEDFRRGMNGAPIRFSTSGTGKLAASLFVGSTDGQMPQTRIRPALRDIAQLLDRSDYNDIKDLNIKIRLSVKFGEAYFEPVFDPITVEGLVRIAIEGGHDGRDVTIVPAGAFDCSVAQEQKSQDACQKLKVDSNGFIFQ